MADSTPNKSRKAKAPNPAAVVFDTDTAGKPKASKTFAVDAAADVEDAARHAATPAERGRRRRNHLLRRACCVLAAAAAAAAVAMLALSLTMLKVRDPTLSMDSIAVQSFRLSFGPVDDHPLRINLTLVPVIAIRNPNYESMRFGASATEVFLDGADGGVVGLGSAPPREVAARGTTTVRAAMDVFVDRVGAAVVREVLLGGGEVPFASRTELDGRISVLGGLYGRRTVRVAMRCRVAMRVSAAAVFAAGSPSCVAEFGR